MTRSGFPHPECALRSWTLEGLCAFPGIDDQLDEFQVVELSVGLHLGALGIEAYPSVGLLVSAHPQVGDRSRGHESDVRSPGRRVKLSANHYDQCYSNGPALSSPANQRLNRSITALASTSCSGVDGRRTTPRASSSRSSRNAHTHFSRAFVRWSRFARSAADSGGSGRAYRAMTA